jgi:hypothetical protein
MNFLIRCGRLCLGLLGVVSEQTTPNKRTLQGPLLESQSQAAGSQPSHGKFRMSRAFFLKIDKTALVCHKNVTAAQLC